MTSAPSEATEGATGGRDGASCRPDRFVRFVARRLGALVALSIGITFIAFVLTQLVPGDPIRANLGQIAQIRPAGRRGVPAPLRPRQAAAGPVPACTSRTCCTATSASRSRRTTAGARTTSREFIPATAELALTSIVIAVIVGVGLGVLAAVRREQARPTTLLRVVSLAGISVPTFWLALVALYVFFFKLNWVPGGGRLDPGVLDAAARDRAATPSTPLLAGQWATFWDALRST